MDTRHNMSDTARHESGHALYAHAKDFQVLRVEVGRDGSGITSVALPYTACETFSHFWRMPYTTMRTVQYIIGYVLAGPAVGRESLNPQEEDFLAEWRAAWPRDSASRWSQLYSAAHEDVQRWLARPYVQRDIRRLALAILMAGGILEGPALIASLAPPPVGVPKAVAHTPAPTTRLAPARPVPLQSTPAAPQRMWWDGALLVRALTMMDGSTHYADGRRRARDGTITFRREWQSPMLVFPDGHITFDCES